MSAPRLLLWSQNSQRGVVSCQRVDCGLHNHVGDDELSVRLLSNPAMVTHALAAFDALPALAEARRWHDGRVISRPLTLRSGQVPNVVVTPGKGLSTTSSDAGVVVELAPHEVPLVLWGRCPSRLRDPAAGAETLDEVLRRLCNDE